MKTSEIDNIKAKYQIVGRAEQLDRAIDTAMQVARTDLSVLIQGESGVGKEVIPHIIHDHSPRKNKRYIAINCGSIPEGTIDSELFGHEKGSFSGAVGEHDGYFAAADGGTLFLDEVGELPMSTQARLLRVLETGEYIRVGSNTPRKTNVRIVAATNVQMQQAINEGRFREDLYFRLCTISIKLPPLRDRGDDVIRLFKKFAMDTAAKYNIPMPLRLTPDAEQVMMAYKWPGNIRQLRNVAEQMSILCKDDRTVTPEVLSRYDIVPNGSSTNMATVGGPSSGAQFDYGKERTIIFGMLNQLVAEVKALKESMANQTAPIDRFSHGHMLEAPHSNALSVVTDVVSASATVAPASHLSTAATLATDDSYDAYTEDVDMVRPATIHHVESIHHIDDVHRIHTSQSASHSRYESADVDAELLDDEPDLNLERIEKKAIEEALKRNRNRRKLAAVDLGISERTLYRKIKDYGIDE